MPRIYEHYTPLNLSELERKQAIMGHISACVKGDFISAEEGSALVDTAMRIMAETWTNELSMKRWAKAKARDASGRLKSA